MPMTVKLRTVKQVTIDGTRKMANAGDWVTVGNQLALRWIECGDAEIPEYKLHRNLVNCGVVAPRDTKVGSLPVSVCDPALVYARTLIWRGTVPLDHARIDQGFHMLDAWHLAVPLHDYDKLALDFGTEQERLDTKAVIIDLRVPVYNTAIMWVKRCPQTIRLIELWESEPGDRDLAFLRALWQVKPLIYALPHTWGGGKDNER